MKNLTKKIKTAANCTAIAFGIMFMLTCTFFWNEGWLSVIAATVSALVGVASMTLFLIHGMLDDSMA